MKFSIELNSPHVGQNLVRKHARRFNVCLLGRRWGKTDLSYEKIIFSALQGKSVGLYAQIFKDVEKTWDIVRTALQPVTKYRNEAQHIIELINGGKVEFWSLKDIGAQDSSRGREYDVVIYDETQKINSAVLQHNWEKVVRIVLAKRKGEAWFFGTVPASKTHYFYRLFLRGAANNPKAMRIGNYAIDCEITPEILSETSDEWISFRAPSWGNPTLPQSEIDAMRRELPAFSFAQEVECRFVESAGAMFLQALQDEAIQQRVFSKSFEFDKRLPTAISFDFNNRIMAAVLLQYTQDLREFRAVREFGAFDRKDNFSIYGTTKQIKQFFFEHYGVKVGMWDGVQHGFHLPIDLQIIGDATGRSVLGQTPDNMNWYQIIVKELGLVEHQHLRLLRRINPTHEASFIQCNLYLEQHRGIYVDAKRCPHLKSDMFATKMNSEGKIDKKTHDGHNLDCWRYGIWSIMPKDPHKIFNPYS